MGQCQAKRVCVDFGDDEDLGDSQIEASETEDVSGEPVFVNVYSLMLLNETTERIGVGVYHSGIVVYGREYSFAGHYITESSGLKESEPRDTSWLNDAVFREQILLGHTQMSREEVQEVFASLKNVYLGPSYNVLSMNCNHFSQDFARRLTGKKLPAYINRLLGVAKNVRVCLPDMLKKDLREQEPPREYVEAARRAAERRKRTAKRIAAQKVAAERARAYKAANALADEAEEEEQKRIRKENAAEREAGVVLVEVDMEEEEEEDDDDDSDEDESSVLDASGKKKKKMKNGDSKKKKKKAKTKRKTTTTTTTTRLSSGGSNEKKTTKKKKTATATTKAAEESWGTDQASENETPQSSFSSNKQQQISSGDEKDEVSVSSDGMPRRAAVSLEG